MGEFAVLEILAVVCALAVGSNRFWKQYLIIWYRVCLIVGHMDCICVRSWSRRICVDLWKMRIEFPIEGEYNKDQ